VSLGANVTFTVAAVGSPPLTYQWRLNGTDIPGAMNRTFTLPNVTLANSGQRYSVVVRNALGSTTSREALLSVDPTFIKITTGPIVNDRGTSKGAAWADFDNDGWIDLFVVNRYNDKNFLYRNTGDGSFSKITEGVIVNDVGDFDTCAWGDYDNDGHIDVVATSGLNGGRNILYRNLGNSTFEKIISGPIGTQSRLHSGSAWGDYDRDGFLDLFISIFEGQNRLFHNNGDGTFTAITTERIVNDNGTFNGASWADFDNDGDLDLFVANWPVALSFLYRNNGDGTFANITATATGSERGSSAGPAWGDYDNDGFLDLFVANGAEVAATAETSFLYHNNGDGTFTSITEGPVVSVLGASFSAAWGDYDNDGLLDLFVSNGGNFDNFLYRNEGNGRFTRITTGSLVHDGGYSVGCVWGDYDNDGFIDLFVANGANSQAQNDFLYRNNGNPNAWINIKCVGRISNRSAIGAKVRVKASIRGQTVWQLREISGGNGYGSQNDLRASFGLGDATAIDTVRIEWPSGIVQEIHNVAAKQFLTVTEPNVTVQPKKLELEEGASLAFKLSTDVAGLTEIQWQFNGANLIGETNVTLIIANASEASLGKYTVVASTEDGSHVVTSVAAQMTLPGPPGIAVQPQSQNVNAGDTVTFEVSATGAEPLSYHWRFEDQPIPSASEARLTIVNAQPINVGNYTVVITNRAGRVMSDAASLNLLGAPVIGTQPRNTSVSLGATAAFRVVPSGTRPLSYQWFSNEVAIAGATTDRLELRNAVAAFAASYRVVVNNALGTVSSLPARLEVDPTFTKIMTGPVVTERGYAAGATWGDYNNDGRLDLYVGRQSGQANSLYMNNGDGTFTSIRAGPTANLGGDTRGTVWGDFDNDSYLDLFVTNGDPARRSSLYHNTGDGTFSRVTNSVAGPIVTDTGDMRGAVWGDFDNDGFLDIFVPHGDGRRRALYRNHGDSTFSSVSAGNVTGDRGGYTIGSSWGDYNNDGLLDL